MRIFLLLLFGLFALLVLPKYLEYREGQNLQENLSLQKGNAENIVAALNQYKEKHGAYPDRLEKLIESGILTRKQYEDWKFRAKLGGNPQEWLYAPWNVENAVINNPIELRKKSFKSEVEGILAFPAPTGIRNELYYIRPDGSIKGIMTDNKWYALPWWIKEKVSKPSRKLSDNRIP